uniref:Uncharacterized protein n=1 Tax=Oryza nivara TaxID=4536 RepID=A0A0E0FPP0_ORYNI
MGEAESSCSCHGGGGPRRCRGGGDHSARPCQRERAKEEDGKPFAAESQPSAADDASEDSPSASAPMAQGPRRTPWRRWWHHGRGSMGAASAAAR